MVIEGFPREGKKLTQVKKFFAFVLMAGTLTGGTGFSVAQTPNGGAVSAGQVSDGALIYSSVLSAVSPVESVRYNKSWEYGPFVNYGNGVGDRSDFRFLWGGFQ